MYATAVGQEAKTRRHQHGDRVGQGDGTGEVGWTREGVAVEGSGKVVGGGWLWSSL